MTSTFTLFEVSWEVCNKVGGIFTVISTKAKTLVQRFGDEYVAIGPWLLSDTDREFAFEDDPAYASFAESCRRMGVPVRVGRWRIPGTPRAILVDFSGLLDGRDGLFSKLWERYGVDSIHGSWDYAEPVLFGHAAGKVIERWWEEYLAPQYRRAVVQCHEWMTGSALLYLKHAVPSIGTVFTTHATVLGRALSSLGHSPDDGLGDQLPADLAKTHNVVAKHSIEGVCAREADAFTTVSTITAKEAQLLHGRPPSPVLPNGIDLEVIDEIAGGTTREEARTALRHLASRFVGEDIGDAAFLCASGRYEFHNKGLDVALDALGEMEGKEGRRIVLFVLVPAGNSGVKGQLLERLEVEGAPADGPIGISTHNLFDEETDPIHGRCQQLRLENAPGSRVKIVHVPIYLGEKDGLLDMPYEAVLRAMDLTCFPSYYEPWGYTPQESLAVGVPTITSDYAGFGRWALEQKLEQVDGVTVLKRVHLEYRPIVTALAGQIESFLREGKSASAWRDACRRTASRTGWSDLIANYEVAFAAAVERVHERLVKGVVQRRRPKTTLSVQAAREGQRPHLMRFDVAATLPDRLAGLQRLARNYWWCWDPEGARLFEELSPLAWEACEHNPVLLLQRVYPEDLEQRAADAAYIAKLHRVLGRLDRYMAEDAAQGKWSQGDPSPSISTAHPVAYFCAEYGIHESLPTFSGGLGVLAGDHLKSASDLNLPMVAVGLFYRMGYLTQSVSPGGEQIAVDRESDPRTLPLESIRTATGEPLEIALPVPGRELLLRAWLVRVGRVSLYLLDTNTPSNRPEDRDITRNLYGGDHETRLKQEIVLGRGGVRLLRTLGIEPSVFHMNEGHAAFLTLERVGQLARKEGLTFDEAREFVRSTTMFTTHTPIPAGHDRFGEDVLRRYFSDVPDWFGTTWDRFMSLGRAPGESGDFNMTYLALNFSSYCNGVSELHGSATRRLLRPFWPGLIESEVPAHSITNGIHLPTWTHPEIAAALGVTERPIRGEDFARAATAEAAQALWKAKRGLKRALIDRLRVTLRRAFVERSDSPLLLNRTLDGLDEEALWIGFARRFAPYKRAGLVFQDAERLRRILSSEERPVRLIIGGKAHPRDELGKDILKSVVAATRRDEFVGKVFFIEDYDVEVARALVQGVDVWLNNPVRLLEASGTSGMKVSANGGLNLSIGDGWWPEAYDGSNGWLIADGRVYADHGLQDIFDSAALYQLLEEEVVPDFFERDAAGLPRSWLERVRRNLATVPPVFNTDRMVLDYTNQAYRLLARAFLELSADRRAAIKTRVQRLLRIRKGFPEIRIAAVSLADLSDVRVGDSMDVHVEIELGTLEPDDVVVELVLGFDKDGTDLHRMTLVPLQHVQSTRAPHVFEGAYRVERSGSYAYGIRVQARTEDGAADALGGLVLWA